jgi:hypothetical protein
VPIVARSNANLTINRRSLVPNTKSPGGRLVNSKHSGGRLVIIKDMGGRLVICRKSYLETKPVAGQKGINKKN